MSLSGTALHCWAQAEGSLEKAKKLAAIVGCPSGDIQRMVDCLRIRPADELTQAIEEYMPFTYNPFTPFGPVVEKAGGKSTFIDQSPIDILTSGEIPQDSPWIASVVGDEGFDPLAPILADESLLDELNKNWESLAAHMLDFNYTVPEKDQPAVAELIREYYLGSSPIDMSTANKTVQMVGDRLFVYDAERAAKLQARANRSPVQFYYFSYKGAHSFSDLFTTINFGVSHFDDLAYIWKSYFDPTTTARDREMQRVMIKLVVSFATNGTPDVGVEWTRLSNSSTDQLSYLHIAGQKKKKSTWKVPRTLGIRIFGTV